ncbi:MAG: hypothetical protein LBG58_10475 [Planctomycetaceae bacterium]|nr:hypothetical protein [Planctomycetaceae bacterium]
MIDDDFFNHGLHSIIKIIVQTISRRVAAGWLVLPFQGERMTVTHKRKTFPAFYVNNRRRFSIY